MLKFTLDCPMLVIYLEALTKKKLIWCLYKSCIHFICPFMIGGKKSLDDIFHDFKRITKYDFAPNTCHKLENGVLILGLV